MSDQRAFWNERFGKEGYFYGTEPNRYVAERIDVLTTPKKILFLGEGEGRNAIYAARAGHTVTALDASDIGLAKCADRAKCENLSVELIHTDLEVWEPSESYDAVLCSFLHLPEPLRSDVFAKVLSILNPGGSKDESLHYTANALEEILERHPCDILELIETDTELNEGRGHVGIASVVRLTVRKP